MPDARNLAVLADLRSRARVTLDEMARACGLGKNGRDSASAWELGQSKPHPRRRTKFIDYLGITLKLRNNPERFHHVWSVLVEEWEWQPVEEAEWEQHFQSVAVASEREMRQDETSILSSPSSVGRRRFPFPAPLPPGSRMPFSHNTSFVGRLSELRAIASVLLPERGAAAISQSGATATTGLGGIGKTQLAVEFVHRYSHSFSGGIFWLSFAQPDAIAVAIAACGGQGHLALRDDFEHLSLDVQVRLVMKEWSKPDVRLLVFDNCEDPGLLARWRPQQGGCRILITSRRSQWGTSSGVHVLLLSVLSRQAGVRLLRRHCPELPSHEPSLTALCAELDDLPLALHLAGSYLARYSDVLTPSTYLRQLRDVSTERSSALLSHPSLTSGGRSPTDHLQHVARTFAVSYDQLGSEQTDHIARALLARAAHFASGEPIPRTLLFATLQHVGAMNIAEQEAEEGLRRVLSLGLLEPLSYSADTAPELLRMHRLLVLFVQQEEQDTAAQRAVEEAIYAKAHAYNEANSLRELMALQAHLRFVTDAALPRQDARAADLSFELCQLLYQIEDYDGAQHYNGLSLAIRTNLFGSEHERLVPNLHYGGWITDSLGQATEAITLHQRGLAIRQQAFGEEHLDTAVSYNYVGTAFHARSDYREAEQYYKQALTIREQVVGKEHPITAQSLNNIGLLLNAQGRYTESYDYLVQAKATREKLLPPDHPLLLITLNNLGYTLRSLGRYEEARRMLEWVLEKREKMYGEHSAYVAVTLNHLGRLHYYLGDYGNAHHYLKRALSIREQLVDEVHYEVGNSRANMGMLLFEQGDYSGARPYLEQALSIQERLWDTQHRHIARSLNHLGLLLHAEGEFDAAQRHFERALLIREKVLGAHHPDTANSYGNLGMVLLDKGKVSEARRYLEAALSAHKKVLGEAHHYTARSLDRLGMFYLRQGQKRLARQHLRSALAIYEQVLGSEHLYTIKCRSHGEAT